MARMYHLSCGRVVVWNWDSKDWKSWAYLGSRVVVILVGVLLLMVVMVRRGVAKVGMRCARGEDDGVDDINDDRSRLYRGGERRGRMEAPVPNCRLLVVNCRLRDGGSRREGLRAIMHP